MSEPTAASPRPRLRRLTVAAYTVFLAAVSLWPKPPDLPGQWEVPNADKIAHTLLYAAYAWLMLWAARRGRASSLGFATAVVVYGIAFGALMEVLQATLDAPYRSGTIGDGVANAVGCLIGAGVFLLPQPRRAALQ